MRIQNRAQVPCLIVGAALMLALAAPALATVTSVTVTTPLYAHSNGTADVPYTVVVDTLTGDLDRQVHIVGVPTVNPPDIAGPLSATTLNLTTTVTVPTAVGEGAYNVKVSVRQRLGNGEGDWGGWQETAWISGGFIVDNTPPTIPGTPSGSPNPNKGAYTVGWDASTDPISGGVASGVGSYELQERYSSDGGTNWTAWSTVASPTTNSYSFSGKTEGLYKYQVRAKDRAGNVSAYSGTSASVMVDTTAPTSSILTPSDGATITVGIAVSVTGTADDPTSNGVASGVASVAVSVYEGTTLITTLTVTGTTSWSASWTPAAVGTYTITSVATDNAGNVQDPGTSITVTVVAEEEGTWKSETAWAAGLSYNEQGNWATYTPYSGTTNSVTLYAGQTMNAGTVSFSAPVEGQVTITITLNSGWRFKAVSENVKIQDYATAPSGNPEPGQFDHKYHATGSSVSVDVPVNNFYGVHVDVEHSVPTP